MLIAYKAYLYLVNQDQSAWTWELDRAAFSFLYSINLLFTPLWQSGLPTKNGKQASS